MPSNYDAELRIGADATGITTAMRQAADAVRNGMDSMRNQFGGLQKSFESMNRMLEGIAVVLAGGKIFKEAVDATVKMAVEAQTLSRTLGISATEASVLNLALGDVYATSEQVITATSRITQKLNEDETAFKQLGVAARDSNGHLRNTFDIMIDVNGKLNSLGEGIDRNVAMQRVYGRGWAELIPLLRLNGDALDGAREKAQSLNLALSAEGEAAVNDYRAAINDAGDGLSALSKTIGNEILPMLTDLAQAFSSTVPVAVDVLRGVMGTLTIIFYGFKESIDLVWVTLRTFIEQASTLLQTLGEFMARALVFDFAGANASWQAGMNRLREISRQYGEEIYQDAVHNQQRINDALARLRGEPGTPTKRSAGGTGSESNTSTKAQTEAQIAAFRVQEAEAGKNAQRIAEIADARVEYVARAYGKETKEYQQALAAQVEAHQKASEQSQRIAQMEAEQKSGWDKHYLDERMRYDQLLVDMHLITNDQLLADERAHEDAVTDIRRRGLEARLAQIDQTKDPEAWAKTNAELETLEMQHAAAMNEIHRKQIAEDQKYVTQYLGSLEQGFKGVFVKLMNGALTLTGLIKELLRAMLASLIDVLAQIAARWLTQQIAQVLMGKQAAQSTIMSHASEAYAAAWASTAAIPVVGPAMAPAAASSAYAGALGAQAFLAVAEQGYDVPAGINPLTQLHQREMVLPAAIAEPLRQMASSGGIGGSGINITVQAMDSRDVIRSLQEGGALKKAIRELAENRAFLA